MQPFTILTTEKTLSKILKKTPKNDFFTKKSWHIITNYGSPYMKLHSLYFTQSPKYEPFSCYGELKISMLCIYVMYELAQLKNFIEQSEFEMAGYL